MGSKEEYQMKLMEILPEAAPGESRAAEAAGEALRVTERRNAAAIAKERRRQAARKARAEAALGRDPSDTAAAARKADAADNLAVLDGMAREPAGPLSAAGLSGHSPEAVGRVLAMQGPSRPEMDRLFASLGMNLDVRLGRRDTARLLACLLTCNESQLLAVAGNPRVPVVLRTAARRILADSARGDMSMTLTLWNRVFGQGALEEAGDASGDTADTPTSAGRLPSEPVSREAYLLIREKLLR